MKRTTVSPAIPGGRWLILGLLCASIAAPVWAIEEPIPLDKEGVVDMAMNNANAMVVVQGITTNGRYNFVTKGKIEETVTLVLQKVSIQDALDAVTQTCGLEYRVQGRIVTLYGKDADSSFTSTYRFKIASVATMGGPGVIIRRLVEGGSDVEAVAASSGGGLASGIEAAVAGGAAPSGGGDKGSKGRVILDRGNNQLIVTAVPSMHRKVAKLIAELDKVLEVRSDRKTRIFELRYITPDFFRKAVTFEISGFQENQALLFSETGPGAPGTPASPSASPPPLSGGVVVTTGDVEGNLKRVLVTETEENLNRIENLLRAIDRPPRQVFLDVKLVSLNRSALNKFGNQLRLIMTKDGRNEPVAEFFGNNTSDVNNPFKLKVGTLGPEQFQLLADYLENKSSGRVLSNPRLTVVDGRSAQIKTVTQEPYGETTVNQGVVQTQAKFIDVGITLNFAAAIMPDCTIKLAVQPEVSSSLGNATLGTNFQVPRVSKTSANTTLLIKDGDTALIGGIIDASETRVFTTMPLLGHIPLLGRLFHKHDDGDSNRELLITITTKILNKGEFKITSKPRASGTGSRAMKYFFHDYEQIGKRFLFIDEVVEF